MFLSIDYIDSFRITGTPPTPQVFRCVFVVKLQFHRFTMLSPSWPTLLRPGLLLCIASVQATGWMFAIHLALSTDSWWVIEHPVLFNLFGRGGAAFIPIALYVARLVMDHPMSHRVSCNCGQLEASKPDFSLGLTHKQDNILLYLAI